MQEERFLENIKRAGRNRRAGGKFSGKSIILQVILIFETEEMIVNFIDMSFESFITN